MTSLSILLAASIEHQRRQKMLCKDCHHKPSERNANCGGYVAACYCKCHDVADAAPELLEVCERLVRIWGTRILSTKELVELAHGLKVVVDATRAVIAKAKGA